MTPLGGQLLVLLSFVGLSHACSCGSLSWATCDESSCECYIIVGEGQRQILNCTVLIPKCFLMKAEMYRLQYLSSSQNKPKETSLADSDELYDAECESSGLFKAKQCNNTDVCWCVDIAGVRHSDLGDRNLKCEEGAESNAVAGAMQEMGQETDDKMKVEYDFEASLITLDVKNSMDDWTQDLAGLLYYMHKDVEVEPTLSGQQVEIESILVYYEEEKTPVVGMQRLTVGIVAVAAVVTLAILVGLLILFLTRRSRRGQYEKAQTSEMEEI